MASDIQLTAAVRQNLLSLQNTAELMSRTQTRLATGNKVNSALDNPINFFTAQGLNSRASELNGLLDSMSNAVSTIEAADKGLSSLTKMVEQSQATIRQALQDSSVNLSYTGTAAPAITLDASGGANDTLTLELLVDADGNGSTADAGDAVSLTVAVNSDAAAVTMTAQQVVDGINQAAREAADGTAGSYVRASLSETGEVVVEAVGGRALSTVADGGTNDNALIFGADPGATDIERTGALINERRSEFAAQYTELLGQMNAIAKDASFNGVNLLAEDDLKVTFNEKTGTDKSELTVSGKSVDWQDLGISIGWDGATPPPPGSTPIDFQSDADLDRALTELSEAMTKLQSYAAEFGSNLSVVEIRRDFTKDMINTLQGGAAKLTLADTNEEGANMLALQTRQQLSSTALSLSTQADQNVLRLF